MTSASPARPPAPTPSRPGGASPGGSGIGIPTIDPVKLLKKYAWLLAAAAVAGAVLGVAAFFVLRMTYPIYRSSVMFEALPVQGRIDEVLGTNQVREDEMERFMLTQTAYMRSETVMHTVVNDPRLRTQAPKWTKSFEKSGQFQAADAANWLLDKTRARVLPGTYIIELSIGWRDPKDAHAIAGLIREGYLRVLDDQRKMVNLPHRSAMERSIRDLDRRISDLQNTRDLRIRTEQIDSLDERTNESTQGLAYVVGQLVGLRMNLQAAESQIKHYREELESPGGVTYSDDLRKLIDDDPQIRNITHTITSLKANQSAMLQRGLTPEHRNYQALQSLIDSWEQTLETERTRLLRQNFDAILESLTKGILQLRAQEADLLAQRERYTRQLNDLTRLKVELTNLEQQLNQMITSRNDLQNALDSMRQIDLLDSAARIKIAQVERIPDKPAFPNIFIMIPGGIILLLGLTGGIVFLREMLDQRVKGPSDVTLIPRTPLLGIVPDAAEDPDEPKSLATVFRDHPKGVTAESFRQLRAPLSKRLSQAGHKTVMVMAGMPGSGATTVALNLGAAFAASNQRVLIIDANFRRPATHTMLGLNESPGLADVLAGEGTLADTVQHAGSNLDVLTAGTAARRVFENLATDAIAGVLAQARESGYDLVLIDVAPAIVSSDGMALANRCDATILVVRAYNEKRGMVARVRNQLGDMRSEFVGVVINGVRAAAGGYMRRNIKATHDYQNNAA